MTEAPISTPPQAYMDIISPMIDKARGFLEAGEKLQPMAFVGNLTTKEIIPVMIQTGSGEGKDQSARTIQSAALALEADFVFAIMEAWTLRPDKMRQMNAILDKYGSIGASPYAIDTCPLTLETTHGLWAARTPRITNGSNFCLGNFQVFQLLGCIQNATSGLLLRATDFFA